MTDAPPWVNYRISQAPQKSQSTLPHLKSGLPCAPGRFDLHVKFLGPFQDSPNAIGGKRTRQSIIPGRVDPKCFEKSPEALRAMNIYPGTGNLRIVRKGMKAPRWDIYHIPGPYLPHNSIKNKFHFPLYDHEDLVVGFMDMWRRTLHPARCFPHCQIVVS